MNSGKRFLSVLAGLISGTLLGLLFARIRKGYFRRRLLKKVDVFAEPLNETFNELIDSIMVRIDKAREALSVYFEQKKTGRVETDRNIKNTTN